MKCQHGRGGVRCTVSIKPCHKQSCPITVGCSKEQQHWQTVPPEMETDACCWKTPSHEQGPPVLALKPWSRGNNYGQAKSNLQEPSLIAAPPVSIPTRSTATAAVRGLLVFKSNQILTGKKPPPTPKKPSNACTHVSRRRAPLACHEPTPASKQQHRWGLAVMPNEASVVS